MAMMDAAIPAAQTALEALGTGAFALSGVIEAVRRRLDAVGVAVAAFLTAFGGGTVRDVLLDHRPFFWVREVWALWGVLVLCALSLVAMRTRHLAATERAMWWPDALGLGLFAASGTQVALAEGSPTLVAAMLGVVSAVFGGALRDVACACLPSVFSDHRPYAVCAFAGAWCVIAAHWAGASPEVQLLLGATVTVALRALALRHNWRLPAWPTD